MYPLALLTVLLLLLPRSGRCAGAHEPAIDPHSLIVEISLEELQRLTRRGALTCESIIRAHIQRIQEYDKLSGLNAITVLNENAVAQAKAIDLKIGRGQHLGALFCAPVLVKDNINVAGIPTTGGSIALKSFVPASDAAIVARIRAADAIILAKTNMAEWAVSARQTVSSSFGTTANAYALDRVPAGSSGGTASGIAASFGVLGIGTDTGNSVRGPASHLALFGLRPTLGLVSRAGIIPFALDTDTAGPMTRTVSDGARLLTVMAGRDPRDPYTDAIPGGRAPVYEAFLDRRGLNGRRIGVLRALAEPSKTNPDILKLFESAIRAMSNQGARIIDPFTIAALAKDLSADGYWCPRFNYDLTTFLKEQEHRSGFTIESLLSSGMHGEDPFLLDTLKLLAAYPADIEPSHWAPPCKEFAENAARLAFRADIVNAMDALRLDALIYPTWLQPPAALSRANEDYAGDNSQLIAPPTGLPAATVPMGWLPTGLPAGLQLVGRPFSEGTLIEISYAFEKTTHHRHAPAHFPALDRPSR